MGRSGRPSRDTGPPGALATTKIFLDDLGLSALSELPSLAELDASHLLENPDATAQATEAQLALAIPVVAPPADRPDAAAEPGAATDNGEHGAAAPPILH